MPAPQLTVLGEVMVEMSANATGHWPQEPQALKRLV